MQYLQFWSSIFESPILKSLFLLTIVGSFVTILLTVFFTFSWLKSDGFEGFEYSFDPKNKDAKTTAMTW